MGGEDQTPAPATPQHETAPTSVGGNVDVDTIVNTIVGIKRTEWDGLTPSGKTRRKQRVGGEISNIITKVLFLR